MSNTIINRSGLPVTSEPLCHTCRHGHIQRGFKASEELTYCSFTYKLRLLPFAVRECTDYEDRRVPEMETMEDSATILTRPLTLGGGTPGFVRSSGRAKATDEDPE